MIPDMFSTGPAAGSYDPGTFIILYRLLANRLYYPYHNSPGSAALNPKRIFLDGLPSV